MANDGIDLVGGFETPDFFADDAMLFDLSQGTIRVTFGVARNETPVAGSKGALVSIGRLIMPVEAAQRLSLGLHDYLVKMNLDPSALVRGDQAAN